MPRSNRKSMWRANLAALLVAILPAAGCDTNDAPFDTPAGSYNATTFLTTTSGQTTDHLAAGSTISLVLTPTRTTSGHLHMAAVGGVPEPFDADLTGSWTTTGTIVELSHAADTFLRDMLFEFDDGTLVGDDTFDGTRIQVTLTRAD